MPFSSFASRRATQARQLANRAKRRRLFECLEKRQMMTNSPPIALDDEFTEVHDHMIAGWVNNNDHDPNYDDLTWSLVNGPAQGQLNFTPDGFFDYTPPEHFTGNVQFSYEVTDGIATDQATVRLNFYNDAPLAVDDEFSWLHDQTGYGYVSENDADPNFDTLTWELISAPGSGDFTFENGYFTYVPPANFAGTVSFTYQVSDGIATDQATVQLTLLNGAPHAEDDFFSNIHNQPITNLVSLNDSDPDGDYLTWEVVTPPASGTFTFDSTGYFEYLPPHNFVGEVTFEYAITDDITSDRATVILSFLNDPPVANGEQFSSFQNTSLNDSVIYNDTDLDGDALTHTLLHDVSSGLLTFSGGQFSYEPAQGFVGTDSFTYRVSDGMAYRDATATIVVMSDSYPSAQLSIESIVEEGYEAVATVTLSHPYNGIVAVDFATADSTAISPADYQGAAGTITFAAGETIARMSIPTTLDKVFDGNKHFTIALTSAVNATLVSPVSHAVTIVDSYIEPVSSDNSVPDAVDDYFELDEDTSVEFSIANLLSNDNDADPTDTLSFVGFDGSPAFGNVEDIGGGVWCYTPDYGFYGTDYLDYRITDGKDYSQARVYFTVFRKDFAWGDLWTTTPLADNFDLYEISEDAEENPGAGIRRNLDIERPERLLENDLLLSGVRFSDALSTIQTVHQVLLRRSSDAIQLWETRAMTGEHFPVGTNEIVYNRAAPGVKHDDFWIEWKSADKSITSATLEVVIQTRNNSGDIVEEFVTDKLILRPFNSIVVGFIGENQVVSDKRIGMYTMVDTLRRNGYDALLFDEDDLSQDSIFSELQDELLPEDSYEPGTGEPGARESFDAIVNAVERMGVEEVAMLGYSHGGGAVYELSSLINQSYAGRLVNDGYLNSKGEKFTIPFTAYVDAVMKQNFVAETHRPIGSQFHLNFYQTGPFGIAGFRPIQGGRLVDLLATDIEDNVDSAADFRFNFNKPSEGVYQRLHTNRDSIFGRRGIMETQQIQDAIFQGVDFSGLKARVKKF